jgi:hypothetical protein
VVEVTAVVTVGGDDMARLLDALRDQFGGSVEALLAAARAGAVRGARRRREPVPFRSAVEVHQALRMKLITRDEARRLLGLRATREAPAGDRHVARRRAVA